MNSEIIIIGFTIILGFIILALFLSKKLESLKEGKDDKSLLMFQQQLSDLQKQLQNGLSESTRAIQDHYKNSFNTMKNVTEELTKVVGITEQLQGLEYILKNPKQRGILGEYHLETLLKNTFPPNQYKMQYSLGIDDITGKELIVDAVLFTKEGVVPIDAKFSLENYNKIVQEKNERIKDELQKKFKQDLKATIDQTAKYIQPGRNTTDFAFMFIPSEGIYYDLLVNKIGSVNVNTTDLIEYAFKKRVIIVSPNSFYAYLQTVLQGLRALKIEESVKDVIKKIQDFDTHLIRYDNYFKKIGSNLSATVSAYNNADKELKKIDKDVTKILPEKKKAIEVVQVDKPQLE